MGKPYNKAIKQKMVKTTSRAIYCPPMPDRHMMIDIETLDVEVNAAIIAIGALTFNPRGEGFDTEDTYHVTISKRSNLAHKRSVSKSTEAWWAQQDQAAQDSVFKGPHVPLHLALYNFARWVNKRKPTCTRVWAKSPDFDCSILNHACKEQNVYWPFKFWEARCVRTIMELAYPEGDFPSVEVTGPLHDALADAKKQVLEVQHAYHVLGA
jgi:hypothetical protein